ncbi:hypothetical protein [Tumebacillus lipolyticus]|uniref:Uncharacterized protein n=1 Tax=Tumebacillus lipolyticus TaxID=1280370 RepID=A0ABW4ZUV5_9BACL
MRATKEIAAVWERFDRMPMETLTKAWYASRSAGGGQRTVKQMREHHATYGTSGNCFDLALWLLDEFRQAGVEAYAIGHDMRNEKAHVAVMAFDEHRSPYLCDLGDMWIQPVLLDPKRSSFTGERIAGFFPGAQVQVSVGESSCEIIYHRAGEKRSQQVYDLRKIPQLELMQAAEASQRCFRTQLVERRVRVGQEVAHWEFSDGESFLSTSAGLFPEPKLTSLEAWCDRIYERTGIAKEVLRDALTYYAQQNG